MIKKICEITNVGIFESFTSTEELQRNNIIFGFNGTGKSTLSDIFYSLANKGKESLILRRKTLSKSIDVAVGDIHIKIQNDNGEIEFGNNLWDKSVNIFTFNDQYVKDYVFVNEEFKQDIALIAMGKEASKLMRQKEAYIKEINEEHIPFINQVISNQSQLFDVISGIGKAKITRKGTKRIKAMSELHLFKNSEKSATEMSMKQELSYSKEIQTLSRCFDSNNRIQLRSDQNYIDVNNISKLLHSIPRIYNNEIAKHMATYMKNNQLSWLLSGYNNQKNERYCPYCGQEIIEADAINFFKEITKFTQKEGLQKAKEIEEMVKKFIQSMNLKLILESIIEYNNILQEIRNEKLFTPKILSTVEIDSRWGDGESTILNGLAKKMWNKVENPFAIYELTNDEKNCIKIINKIAKSVSSLGKILQEAKGKVESKIEKDQNKQQRSALYELSFNALHQEVETAIGYAQKIINSEESIKKIEVQLNDLFDDIKVQKVNEILKQLNVKFALIIKDRKYYIQLKDYIPKEYKKLGDDETICSEGEKKALAFAFFLAEISDVNKTGEKIIVIDDPISSLDLSRKSVVAYQISLLMKDLDNQTLILSHDISFIEKIVCFTGDSSNDIKMIELKNNDKVFEELDINDYLLTDEKVYLSLIEQAITSSHRNDKLLGLMALRPYVYIKKAKSCDYIKIEKASTYFAHTIYSQNKSRNIEFRNSDYDNNALTNYINLVNSIIGSEFNSNEFLDCSFSFSGFDYLETTSLYKSFPLNTISEARKKALVLRIVLESCLFQLVEKMKFDPERIGNEYSKAIKGTTGEKKIMCKKLKELYDQTKKYHHGAEDGSTLGLSWINTDEIDFFDTEISKIIEYIDSSVTTKAITA